MTRSEETTKVLYEAAEARKWLLTIEARLQNVLERGAGNTHFTEHAEEFKQAQEAARKAAKVLKPVTDLIEE